MPPQSPSTLLQVAGLHSFLWPSHIPLYVCTTSSLLTDPWIAAMSSVHSVVSDSLRPRGLQHTRAPCPSPTPRAYSNSSALSQWCHPTVSSSVVPFSSCPLPFPASESFPSSQFFPSDGQRIGVPASASVLPMNTQDWSPNNKLTEYNYFYTQIVVLLLLLLLSRFSRVRLCATPETADHQAPPSLGFSRQEQWSGLPFPSPTHASEKWKWRRSTASDS